MERSGQTELLSPLLPHSIPLMKPKERNSRIGKRCNKTLHIHDFFHCNRVLMLTMRFAFLLLFSTYTSLLTADITAGVPVPPINSFADVLLRNYQVLVIRDGSNEGRLRSASPGTAMHMVYRETVAGNENALCSNLEEAVAKLREAENRLLYTSSITSYVYESLRPLHLTSGAARGYNAFALRRGSGLAPVFNYHLLRLKERGLLEAIRRRWMTRHDEETSSGIATGIGFETLALPFLALASGIVGAVLLLVSEIAAIQCFQFNACSAK